jgi:mRNA interferase RelE/StbE
MPYQIEVLPAALRSMKRLDKSVLARIDAAILHLANDPRPPMVKKLVNQPGWRIRVGDYRIIYQIYDDRLVVLVVDVGHRRDIYR